MDDEILIAGSNTRLHLLRKDGLAQAWREGGGQEEDCPPPTYSRFSVIPQRFFHHDGAFRAVELIANFPIAHADVETFSG